MRTINLGQSGLQVPAVAVGCMRMSRIEKSGAEQLVKTALDLGAVFFDHADVYGDGSCEEIFADVIGMTAAVRDKIFLQSKCGIRRGVAFDFSRDHILRTVDGSLKRLKAGYLDVLLLHRPDALVEPEEVAEAFGILHSSGKVRHFGVSNQNPGQIRLLQKFVKQPLIANQLQLSAASSTMISQGILVNTDHDRGVNRDGGVLDFCRLHDITIQTWSPFLHGPTKKVFLGNGDFPALNAKIDEIAQKHGVSPTTIALAWILRHPAKMQPVTGTMKPDRLRDCVKALDITLSRDEWYAIYLAAGNILP